MVAGRTSGPIGRGALPPSGSSKIYTFAIMNKTLDAFIVQDTCNILDAMKEINNNTKGFLVVVNSDKVVGVITDGDIRRAIINGATTDDCIADSIVRKYTSLSPSNDISDVIEIFKNKAIKFLPVLNSEEELINILTKAQLHSLFASGHSCRYVIRF